MYKILYFKTVAFMNNIKLVHKTGAFGFSHCCIYSFIESFNEKTKPSCWKQLNFANFLLKFDWDKLCWRVNFDIQSLFTKNVKKKIWIYDPLSSSIWYSCINHFWFFFLLFADGQTEVQVTLTAKKYVEKGSSVTLYCDHNVPQDILYKVGKWSFLVFLWKLWCIMM